MDSVKTEKSNDDDSKRPEVEDTTPWASIYMCGACAFIQAAQFSIYFSSMWPYLKSLDSNIPETMLGYIVALYSLAQLICAPTFGYWSNKLEQVRIPLITGFSCMAFGNILYLCLQFLPIAIVPYVMMLARMITGAGTGNATVLRTYAASASTLKDRARAIACVTSGIAVGTMFGPAFQLLFTPLAENGFHIGPFIINIYTGPAVLALSLNILGVVLMSKFFKEKRVIYAVQGTKRDGTAVSLDTIAIAICVLTRFSQVFMMTTIETLGSPYSMMMFSFTKEEAVAYNAAAHALAGVMGTILYFVFIVFNVTKLIRERATSILCQVAVLALFVSTYSYPFIGDIVAPRINGSDDGCDVDRFAWCKTLTTTSPWIYYSFYVLIFGVAFTFLNVAITTLFSKIIGPRKQGTLQGVFQMAGSIGRLLAPLFMSQIYTIAGPRSVWLVEIAEIGITVLIWLVFCRRMVPFNARKERVEEVSPS